MKKLKGLFILPIVFGAFAFSNNAIAEETTGEVDYISGNLIFDPEKGNGDATKQLPTNLDFGSHEIQTETAETWYATSDGTGLRGDGSTLTRGAVAVSDNRGAAASSWAVKVKQSAQFTVQNTPLSGAVLTIATGALTNNLNTPPTGSTDIAGNQLVFDTFNSDYDVLTANSGEGSGETSLPINEVSLNVPANSEKVAGTYQTTLVWTLSSTPTTP